MLMFYLIMAIPLLPPSKSLSRPCCLLAGFDEAAELDNERIEKQCENAVVCASLNIFLDSMSAEMVNSSKRSSKDGIIFS